METLSATARVILGALTIGLETGYEIKQFVDRTTRHFWAASYGQIYPELRRLEAQGLVRSVERPEGGRARTVVSLTPEGRAAFERWRDADAEPLSELRDEGMLRLFFSGDDPALIASHLRRMRAVHARKLDALQEIAPLASAGPMGSRTTWQLGVALNEWWVAWCDAALAQLGDDHGERQEPR